MVLFSLFQIYEKEKLKAKTSLGGSVGDWVAVRAIQRLLVQSHAHVEHEIDLQLLKLCLIECDWLSKVHVAPGASSPGAFMTEIRM